MRKSIFPLGILILVLFGCQKPLEKVPVGEMNDYRDPAFGFKVKYPKEWLQMGTAGKALFAKSQEVVNKLQVDPRTGEEGALVVISVTPYAKKPADSLVNEAKDDLKQTWATIEMQPEEHLTVAGKPSTKVPYAVKVTTKRSIQGFEIYVPGDTALYRLAFVGFGEQFDAHSLVFDAMLQSFELPVIAEKKSQVWQASTNIEKYNSDFFTMEYPDNLNFVQQNKGDKDLVMEMRADRQDCSIHIDVFGAKKLTAEKVWDQNKGKYKSKSTGESTIDGKKAPWADYSPGIKDVASRVYFVVDEKNDKVVRITLNWFVPQKDIYFTVFEKCVNSIKLK